MSLDATDAGEIVIEGLLRAYKNHHLLGKEGLTEMGRNKKGDTTLRADYEGEEIVINTAKEYGLPIKIISEEHGIVKLGNGLVGLADGIDGTNRYRAYMAGDNKARFGTMFGILNGSDPRHEDYLASGVMEHPTNRLVVAIKDQGVFVIDPVTRKRTSVNAPFRQTLERDRIRCNAYPTAKHYQVIDDTFLKTFPEMNLTTPPVDLWSSEAHYVDFAVGDADWVFDCTFGPKEEETLAYAFVKERGGVMVSLDGKDIGRQKYFGFHYNSDEYVPLISAPSERLAKKLVLSRIVR